MQKSRCAESTFRPSYPKWLRLIAAAVAFVMCGAVAQAQPSGKIPRIGYLSGTGNASNQGPYVEALRQGLRDLGYVEGKNFVIEYRGAEGRGDNVPTLVNELVQLKVDVLVVPTAGGAIRAAKQATKTIPIVMVTLVDPVETGLVDSLARPGGNITGLATLQRDLSGKRLELLTEVVPRLLRVGVLRNPDEHSIAIGFKDYQAAAACSKDTASISRCPRFQPRFNGRIWGSGQRPRERAYHNDEWPAFS